MDSNESYCSRIDALKEQHRNEVASLQQNHEEEMADSKIRFDLENTNLQLENIRLMTTAVNDLNQRSELIESIMGTIGVELKKPGKTKSQANTGGPYIPVEDSSYDSLIKQVDKYMEAIRTMPLGKPVDGSISSGFGKRTDPVNRKSSFHEGVDIRGKRGDKIYATASGKVLRAFKNGSYGNYVEIDHGNGYTTAYAHLQSYLVKKGEFINQGQIIGQVGNSGRSTGPHLHYEVRLNKKPINPTKFMKVAELSHTFNVHTGAEVDSNVQ
jgi:murein DD-endopeptidase MepM/ murein hydrolase activator NlpD